MIFTIDASQIIYGTGVSVYTKNLIRTLLNIDKKNTYQIIGGALRRMPELRSSLNAIVDGRKNASASVFPFSPAISDIFFNRIGILSIDTLIGKSDVFHSSDWTQPKTDAFKVTTVHDIAPVLYPKLSHPKIVEVHTRRLERVKKYVDSIIVPSITTKNDLVKLGFDENIIQVIYEAPDPNLKRSRISEILAVKKKNRIGSRYLLAVGVSKRKNIDKIISAFEKIRADRTLKLVVVGHYEKISQVRNVIFLGYVNESDIYALYSGAEALVYPSLYEGFGLPILEAFSLGIPVVTSDIGSMKEIAGSAAMLVDPNDVDSIKIGIEKVLVDKCKLVRLGKQRVNQFSWNKTAQETLGVYNQALKK
ncbi:MAG: Glycosyl transferase group 1 [Candidatus Woesebacteria bacterium GW2011_GWD1_38_10]|uniref:Glycosyl transferase group 1 n=2 Tax=Candidatus Woeseibacteriota TaxID=1752722 RepID=A0A0G0KVI3_9BACT|nr:MAG: Glycosyl transferase group 1 [Candidatus Woesebacteria bacterium GW2011_GWD1_38_10]KKQ75567.1 MAG: Glycosyl transferase group 1 [Microgenomates group bacterium GW2011_GWF1_38_5]KKQ82797.1 MAG: Glycosyl transferase group 1 [Candidatus Woesebacteria bacterium GW2011_GWA1_38_8]